MDANVSALPSIMPNVNTEASCLILSQNQVEGACVIPQDSYTNTCKFTNQVDCQQNLGGKFYPGELCSNPALNTNCKPQQSIECVQGKDEIYWFDSCGNQENIYDSNKVASWNNGLVLPKNESCSLGNGDNPLANQATCGNCNFITGSTCGPSTPTQKLAEPNANVVCTDLSCIDSDGNKRQNGESWCTYQGDIGVDGNRGARYCWKQRF